MWRGAVQLCLEGETKDYFLGNWSLWINQGGVEGKPLLLCGYRMVAQLPGYVVVAEVEVGLVMAVVVVVGCR